MGHWDYLVLVITNRLHTSSYLPSGGMTAPLADDETTDRRKESVTVGLSSSRALLVSISLVLLNGVSMSEPE